ncbi:MAG TPA: hypothetical protein VFB62_28790, partial [Polyangiaceae bacterium]|nr:hypothetical protein [Polyangiaceae bacterium]
DEVARFAHASLHYRVLEESTLGERIQLLVGSTLQQRKKVSAPKRVFISTIHVHFSCAQRMRHKMSSDAQRQAVEVVFGAGDVLTVGLPAGAGRELGGRFVATPRRG